MNQMALALPAARRRDPETSKAAALKAANFAAVHRARILAVLERPGTIYDLAERCGLDRVAIARRLPELARDGLVEPTVARRDGCRVWRLKE